jgi:hypothetical protein
MPTSLRIRAIDQAFSALMGKAPERVAGRVSLLASLHGSNETDETHGRAYSSSFQPLFTIIHLSDRQRFRRFCTRVMEDGCFEGPLCTGRCSRIGHTDQCHRRPHQHFRDSLEVEIHVAIVPDVN